MIVKKNQKIKKKTRIYATESRLEECNRIKARKFEYVYSL